MKIRVSHFLLLNTDCKMIIKVWIKGSTATYITVPLFQDQQNNVLFNYNTNWVYPFNAQYLIFFNLISMPHITQQFMVSISAKA